MKSASRVFAVLMTVLASSAIADIQSDRIRGHVLSVDAEERMLEIEILEVGSMIDAEAGTVETYHVPETIDVEFEIENRLYRPSSDFDFADISRGDTVLLDFTNLTNRTEVNRIRSEQSENVAVRDRVQSEWNIVDDDDAEQFAANDSSTRRTALPDSASAIPMLGVLGMMFALLAGATRYYLS